MLVNNIKIKLTLKSKNKLFSLDLHIVFLPSNDLFVIRHLLNIQEYRKIVDAPISTYNMV